MMEWTVSTDAEWLDVSEVGVGAAEESASARWIRMADGDVAGMAASGEQSDFLVSVDPQLPAGMYAGMITAKAGVSERKIPVQLIVEDDLTPAEPNTPVITGEGIGNAANLVSVGVAPGEIVSIFGVRMGPAEGTQNEGGVLATLLADVMVTFNGVPAPLFYVREDQINAQVPYEVAGAENVQVQVIFQGRVSNVVELPVVLTVPGIFAGPSGIRAVVLNQDGSLNTPENPAAPGSRIVFYATGEGQTDPAGVTGKLATVPYPGPLLPVNVAVGGAAATIEFANGAPGFAGLMQINVKLSDDTPAGESVVLRLTIGNVSDESVIAVGEL